MESLAASQQVITLFQWLTHGLVVLRTSCLVGLIASEAWWHRRDGLLDRLLFGVAHLSVGGRRYGGGSLSGCSLARAEDIRDEEDKVGKGDDTVRVSMSVVLTKRLWQQEESCRRCWLLGDMRETLTIQRHQTLPRLWSLVERSSHS